MIRGENFQTAALFKENDDDIKNILKAKQFRPSDLFHYIFLASKNLIVNPIWRLRKFISSMHYFQAAAKKL